MKSKKDSNNQWILLTGLSGSGKTTALKILEDQGFFAIDNLPHPLLDSLIQLLKKSKDSVPKVVLGMDIRAQDFAASYHQALATLEESGINPEILFFDCNTKVLIRRFSENRRPHPLRKKGITLEKAIRLEKESLEPLRKIATHIVDTSKMNVHQLKRKIHQYLHHTHPLSPLTVTLLSFGFKFGSPVEADMIFDVRFIKNPYFVPKLKNLPGNSPSVMKYVISQKEAKTFITKILSLLNFLIPLFQKEGKSHLLVALGCTGGKHRSVSLVENIKRELTKQKVEVLKIHRDIEKVGE